MIEPNETIVIHINESEESDESPIPCCICLEEIQENDRAIMPCAHGFHKDCIDTWMTKSETCPLCKTSILCNRDPFPIVIVKHDININNGSVEQISSQEEHENSRQAWRQRHEHDMEAFYYPFIKIFRRGMVLDLIISVLFAASTVAFVVMLPQKENEPFKVPIGIISIFCHVSCILLSIVNYRIRFEHWRVWKRYVISSALRKGFWRNGMYASIIMERIVRSIALATTIYFCIVVKKKFSLPDEFVIFYFLFAIYPFMGTAVFRGMFDSHHQGASFWKSFVEGDPDGHLNAWYEEIVAND